ncbi:hypothetical protein SAMN05660748_0696 [Blastococcus aggregatus]|uniref:Uncharacterized protein n=1 Tax=Blastococcus aggregatus TaxID=38502 RepID=A0A285UZH4_9ACTN|nr:hypothetical protein [Blastococcus aggregatus]SOC47220.1 hypothetical protein SAMN05660748_0696 [Blastococcus aggregatus]
MSPSPTQVAALLVAAAAAADVIEHHPSAGPRSTAMELIAAAAEHAAVCDVRRLDRRLGVYAASHANTYLRTFADRTRVSVLRDIPSLGLSRPVAAVQRALLAGVPGAIDGVHPLDLRLLYATPAGVVIDQLTQPNTARSVGVDGFARAAVAAHLALGGQLPSFAGVRLLAFRVPRASRHYRTATDWHLLGQCAACSSPRSAR